MNKFIIKKTNLFDKPDSLNVQSNNVILFINFLSFIFQIFLGIA